MKAKLKTLLNTLYYKPSLYLRNKELATLVSKSNWLQSTFFIPV